MNISQYKTFQELCAVAKKHQALRCNWFSWGPSQERPRVASAAEDTFIRVTSLRNCSPNKCLTDTAQHQLFRGDCESGLHVRIATKKPLLKDTNNKKRLAWAKKHELWTLGRSKVVLWSGVQIGDFWFQPQCLCETRCWWMDVKIKIKKNP